MRILSCYIVGFGKFTEKAFDFTANPVVIKEENGWGKTTLADFIRCMFYGHDAGRGKAVENNDRAKYTPWQGGGYGGSLTFLYGNKKYRVERSFGKTPAYDTTRIYDSNNMQTFEFGDRGERLGETLFGMNAEGYMRSVYIPQGEICTDGLPDTMKNRLLSLLNSGGAGGVPALEKLDEADRALRSKRRPAQGKLDKIDERLRQLTEQKAECDYALLQAENFRKEIANAEREIAAIGERLQSLAQAIDRESRRSELAVKKQAFDEAQTSLLSAERELANLNVFFAGLDPASVNLEGIGNAVSEYYKEKAALEETERRRAALQEGYQRFLTLKARKEGCEKTLDGYDEILDKKSGKKGAGTRRTQKYKKIIPPKRKSNKWILMLGIVFAVAGALLFDKLLPLGLTLLSLGVIGMTFVFFRTLPKKRKAEGSQPPQEEEEGIDPDLQAKYDEILSELDEIQAQIAQLPSELEREYLDLTERKERGEKTQIARAQGIDNFLKNFKFDEIYDYRAAVATLRENTEKYARLLSVLSVQKNRLQSFSQEPALRETDAETALPSGSDMPTLQAQKRAMEEERETLSRKRATALAQLETLQNRTDKNALNAEEETLIEEKRRLEKRHRAILAAKEILIRAKQNLAGRYLDPVEKGCRYYLQYFDPSDSARVLRLNGDGLPLYEEGGMARELGYYSEGMKELVGLCTRFAFADAVFQKETPALILDDPFVNLDDKKTESAKRLVRELAKKYQIVYLTCKTERAL